MEDDPILLAKIPYDDLEPAGFYKVDIFHTVHAGVGKDFAASSVVILAEDFFPGPNVEARLDAANTSFFGFAAKQKNQSAL